MLTSSLTARAVGTVLIAIVAAISLAFASVPAIAAPSPDGGGADSASAAPSSSGGSSGGGSDSSPSTPTLTPEPPAPVPPPPVPEPTVPTLPPVPTQSPTLPPLPTETSASPVVPSPSVPSPTFENGTAPAPTISSITPGNATLEVSLTRPSGGPDNRSYTAVASPGGLSCTFLAVDLGSNCTISGLTNGTTYSVQAYATSILGAQSAMSEPVSGTPAGPPPPVTAITFQPASGAVNISWTAPASSGGGADVTITGYKVNAAPGNGNCVPSPAIATNCIVSGLTNGTTYTFTVTAINSLGLSSTAKATDKIVPVGAPSAPGNVTAKAGNTTATVSWSASASTGGAPLASYTVTSSGDSPQTCQANAPATTCMVSGLTDGTAYTFTVTATNTGNATSPASAPSLAVTPGDSGPAAPIDVSAQAISGGLVVSWSEPGVTGNTSIASYTVTATPGNEQCTSSSTWFGRVAPATTCTLKGLANGTAYSITVIAANTDKETSAPSAPIQATPAGPPAAPTSVTGLQTAPGEVTVSWTEPGGNGGSITGYTATATKGGQSCTAGGDATSCVVTGLANGSSYSFQVTASSGAGTSPASAPSAPVALVGPPAAPTIVAVSAGDAQVSVAWKPGKTAGLPIASFQVTSDPASQGCIANGDATSCVVTGLTNGTAYTFTVTANSSGGQSPPSAASDPVTPASTAPTAPQNVRVSAASGQATVTWSAPSSSGNSSISLYTVTSDPATTTCTDKSDWFGRFDNKCVVTGLANGTSYTFAVTATNKKGETGPAGTSGAITPSGVPSAPLNVNGTAGAGVISVAWAAPDTDGGSAITGYTATATSTSNKKDVQRCTGGGDATSCQISGVTNGSTYSLSVVATNSAGSSPAGAGSAPVTPLGPPSAPQKVGGDSGYQQITVNWAAPASTGGSPIAGYQVVAESDPNARCAAGAKANSCVVTGLTDGTEYVFDVTAVNSAQFTSPAAQSPVLEPGQGLPDAPSVTGVTAKNAAVEVAWSAPADHGTSALQGYTAKSDPGGLVCSTSRTVYVIPPATHCTVSGLTNGTAYTFTVVATNKTGPSQPSAPSASVTPATAPDQPTAVAGMGGDGQVTVSWTAPAATGGPAIQQYSVTTEVKGTIFWDKSPATCTAPGEQTSCVVPGLANGSEYRFYVTADNGVASSESDWSSAVTPAGAPTPPLKLSVSASIGAVKVSWKAPASDGGAPISNYTVTATPGSATCSTDGSSKSCTVSGLTNKTTYAFVATAANPNGTSQPSESVTATPGQKLPDPPSDVTAKAGNGKASVSWTGSYLDRYTVTSLPGDLTCSPLVEHNCTVSGLANGTQYSFTVVARNLYGPSAPSAPSNSVTPVGKPGAPQDATAQPSSGQIQVGWEPPLSDGGSAITGYTATAKETGIFSKGSFTCTSAATNCSIEVPNGKTYSVSVTATTSAGTGPAAKASGDVHPTGPPGAPTDVKAQIKKQQEATISLKAPGDNGGSKITSYTVTSDDGLTCKAKPGVIFSPSCTIKNLAADTTYTFTAVAINADGPGPASAPSDPVTTGSDVPTAPQNVKASTNSPGEALVQWDAPESSGSSWLRSYTATASPGGANCQPLLKITPHHCTISGLTDGTEYTVTVVAANGSGQGTASAGVTVTPVGKPTAPESVTGTPGAQQITVNWEPPASDGGSPVTGYTATAAYGLIFKNRYHCSAGGGATSCVIEGLTNGDAYAITVAAANAKGNSPEGSSRGKVTPVGPPGVPAGVKAKAGDSSAEVIWSAPKSKGGGTISSYTATASPGGQTCTWTEHIHIFSPSCTVKGLTNGTAYTFTVTATNQYGTSGPSAPSEPVTPGSKAPAPPTAVVAGLAGDGAVVVSWHEPETGGAMPVRSYSVTDGKGVFSGGAKGCTVAAPALSCVVTGLKNGTSYSFAATAANQIAKSAPSAPSNSVTPLAVPSAPQMVSASAENGQAFVYWLVPKSNGGSPITSYAAAATPGGRSCTASTAGARAALTFCTISGLQNGSSYTISVTATNAIGTGPAGLAKQQIGPAGPPDVPLGVTAVPGNGAATITWKSPAKTGGSPIVSYTALTFPPVSVTGTQCTTKARSCVIKGLKNGSSYQFAVRAKNKAGSGRQSALTTPIKPGGGKVTPSGGGKASKKRAIRICVAHLVKRKHVSKRNAARRCQKAYAKAAKAKARTAKS